MQTRYLLLLFASSGLIAAGCSSAPATGAGGASGTTSSASGSGGASTSSGGGAGTTTTTTSSSSTGTSSSGGTNYSCSFQNATTSQCILYEGLTSDEVTSAMKNCAPLGGTNGTSCPSANALGTCTETASGTTTITTYYGGTQMTASEAQTTCVSMNGTWTAG